MKYDFAAIEKKWQDNWEVSKPYAAVNFSDKPKFYGLIEFPYPSGQGLHVGHPRPFTAIDIVSRKKRMQGYNVRTLSAMMHLVSLPRTMQLKTTSIPQRLQRTISQTLPDSLKCWVTALTGIELSIPLTPTTTNGHNGYSSSSSKKDLPIRQQCPLTGAPAARWFLRMRRLWRAFANAAALP